MQLGIRVMAPPGFQNDPDFKCRRPAPCHPHPLLKQELGWELLGNMHLNTFS